MRLYHGTSADAAKSILKQGLRPRSEFRISGWGSGKGRGKGSWVHDNTSDPDYVYLTRVAGPFYAQATCAHLMAVVEVETDYLDTDNLVGEGESWFSSAVTDLTVGHRGAIHVNAITRAAFFGARGNREWLDSIVDWGRGYPMADESYQAALFGDVVMIGFDFKKVRLVENNVLATS